MKRRDDLFVRQFGGDKLSLGRRTRAGALAAVRSQRAGEEQLLAEILELQKMRGGAGALHDGALELGVGKKEMQFPTGEGRAQKFAGLEFSHSASLPNFREKETSNLKKLICAVAPGAVVFKVAPCEPSGTRT